MSVESHSAACQMINHWVRIQEFLKDWELVALEWISTELCLHNYHNLDDSSTILELFYKLHFCVFRERSQLNSFTE